MTSAARIPAIPAPSMTHDLVAAANMADECDRRGPGLGHHIAVHDLGSRCSNPSRRRRPWWAPEQLGHDHDHGRAPRTGSRPRTLQTLCWPAKTQTSAVAVDVPGRRDGHDLGCRQSLCHVTSSPRSEARQKRPWHRLAAATSAAADDCGRHNRGCSTNGLKIVHAMLCPMYKCSVCRACEIQVAACAKAA